MSEWQPIGTAPEEVNSWKPVDLWLEIHASPRSFGMSDSFRVTDCWKQGVKWVHKEGAETKELYQEYITHWMPLPKPPVTE